jgi:large subunit ribosomal protein L10
LALTREHKVELVEQYTEQFNQSQGIVLINYKGLNVSQMRQIRDAARPLGGTLQVVKNRLLALALEDVGVSLPDEWLIGPTAVEFCHDEVPPLAKVIVDARKEVGELSIKGGWMEETLLSPDEVKEIAALPSREVLLAQVLGAINGPARQVAGVVASGVRQVMNVLQAYVDKLEESGGSAGAEAAQAVEAA